MNYYQHHIGDFNNATRHLNLIERALYRDLIEMYYDAETAIDGRDFNRLARKLLCRSEEEQQALRFILAEYFEEDDGLYKQRRCEREIEHYHAQREQQSRAGKASAAKRAALKVELRSAQANDLFEDARAGQAAEMAGTADSQGDDQRACDSVATGVIPVAANPQQGDQPTTNQQPLTTTHKTINQFLGKNKKTQGQAENSNADTASVNPGLVHNTEQWAPALITLNHKLKLAGGEAIDQTTLQQTLVLFNPHYEGQCLSHNKRLAKLVAWIMDKQQRARLLQQSMQHKPVVANANGYRNTKGYTQASSGNDEPADHEVYCGQVTYGQLRKAMQAGETYLQCFQRMSMQRQVKQA